jgi:glycosyltransferase involved in cell wall biosynthesis
MTAVYVIVPDSIDDPSRPSGGNVYDRQICDGLAANGWSVYERAVPGSWPQPDAASRKAVIAVIVDIPDGAVVLLDGLIASAVPDVLVPEARRLRLVVLVHMPLGQGGSSAEAAAAQELRVLAAAVAVVTTSAWTREWLLDNYGLAVDKVHVAEPGVVAALPAPGTADGGQLLCVAAVTPNKGHDVLLAALATISDLPWHCMCIGTVHRDPDFVQRLDRQARAAGIADRVCFSGARTDAALADAYAAADVLVLASRAETYGMVVTEALARGLPIIATAVGGLPEALGAATDGSRPGLLVPPDDAMAFAGALRSWLRDVDVRLQLRVAAQDRRVTLPGWSDTADQLSRVLAGVAA